MARSSPSYDGAYRPEADIALLILAIFVLLPIAFQLLLAAKANSRLRLGWYFVLPLLPLGTALVHLMVEILVANVLHYVFLTLDPPCDTGPSFGCDIATRVMFALRYVVLAVAMPLGLMLQFLVHRKCSKAFYRQKLGVVSGEITL